MLESAVLKGLQRYSKVYTLHILYAVIYDTDDVSLLSGAVL